MNTSPIRPFALLACLVTGAGAAAAQSPFRLNEREYFERPGANVMVYQDIYPESHQGGVGLIQNGVRIATNGDLRLEAAPGQWQPVPVQKERVVDAKSGEIRVTLAYPDPDKHRKGFNPIEYPDLQLAYRVRVRAEGAAVRVTVDLDRPLPREWLGKVSFNMELFPTNLFGKGWLLGGKSGLFPRQANGPVQLDAQQRVQPVAFATGKRLVVAPESEEHRLTIESSTGELQLLDGRVNHQNGWFVVRSPVPEGATVGAIEWRIEPHALPGYRDKAVVHVSQVGYHPAQTKLAIVELDAHEKGSLAGSLLRVGEDGKRERVLTGTPRSWGAFLRYRYLQFDFSSVQSEGLYVIEYGKTRSQPFRISREVYKRDVWQPTLEYFLPVQMCHMRVVEKYRVWHGLCHMDDALMAPVNVNHFDGYVQGESTLTKFKPGSEVPGLNVGAWHDAGDDDLRIESQSDEVYILSLAYESFGVRHDNTTVDQARHSVEIRVPDGKPDLLQQIEHGMLNILGGYRSLGRLYRGVIVPTLPQYVLVGDIANQTDNLRYDPKLREGERTATHSSQRDDRLVFTEENPARELSAIAGLAAAGRVLRGYNDTLAGECVRAAEALWAVKRPESADSTAARLHAAVELFLTTRKETYRRFILQNEAVLRAHVASVGWVIGRALPLLADARFESGVREAVAKHAAEVSAAQRRNPFGVPYEPKIWGAGWDIQKFGVDQYFLHTGFPDLVSREHMLNALNFVLGVHPGANTASFASGVGARSMTTAYGLNRADWSYIPGGVVSGTNLVRPDFPEMKEFPYLWQQAEYVLGGGATNFMFLVLAADQLLNR